MLGILLDVGALWAITSFLAKRNMSDDFLRFTLFALALVVVGAATILGQAPAFVALSAYVAVLFFGMKFWIGASWLGSAIGSGLFLAYKIILTIIFS